MRKPSRAVVPLLATALLATLPSLAGGPAPAGAATGDHRMARGAQSGVTELSAPIVQPGRRHTGANRALLNGTVRFSPALKGRRVVIQRRKEGTTRWRKVTRRREDRHGRAHFTGRAYAGRAAFEYRGRALRWHGRRPVNATPTSAAEWQLKFTDEFGGRRLSDKWADRTPTSKDCSRVGDPRARSVRHGTLRFHVKLDPAKRKRTCKTSYGKFRYYLNGQISTQHVPTSFRYGTLSARIKFQRNRGQHGSFWMQPMTQQWGADPQDAGAEIDIVEFFGQSYPGGGLASFFYNYGILDRHDQPVKIGGVSRRATRMLPKRDTWWKRFHVFTIQWTPHSYTFLVDGRPHFHTKRGVVDLEEYLILGLTTSSWELRQAKRLGVKPTGTMQVDWVRAWQQRDEAEPTT